jgi:hypothetical protein
MRFGNTLTALNAATTAAPATSVYSGDGTNGTAAFAPSSSNTGLHDPVGTSVATVSFASPSTRADKWDVSPVFQGQSDGSKNTTEHFKRYGGNSDKPGTSDGDANNAAGMVCRTVETLRAKCPSKADELCRAVVYADFLGTRERSDRPHRCCETRSFHFGRHPGMSDLESDRQNQCGMGHYTIPCTIPRWPDRLRTVSNFEHLPQSVGSLMTVDIS